jgi:hypothetical protein
MPDHMKDDMTFGALMVLYDMGCRRGDRLRRLERWSVFLGGLLGLTMLLIVALHGNVVWLTRLASDIFGL